MFFRNILVIKKSSFKNTLSLCQPLELFLFFHILIRNFYQPLFISLRHESIRFYIYENNKSPQSIEHQLFCKTQDRSDVFLGFQNISPSLVKIRYVIAYGKSAFYVAWKFIKHSCVGWWVQGSNQVTPNSC